VAKRDGLGATILEAVSVMGKLLTTISRQWAAAQADRGLGDVREVSARRQVRHSVAELHLAQNLPFAPMVKAWDKGSRQLSEEDLRPELIGQISTARASTRYPAYTVQGGVF